MEKIDKILSRLSARKVQMVPLERLKRIKRLIEMLPEYTELRDNDYNRIGYLEFLWFIYQDTETLIGYQDHTNNVLYQFLCTQAKGFDVYKALSIAISHLRANTQKVDSIYPGTLIDVQMSWSNYLDLYENVNWSFERDTMLYPGDRLLYIGSGWMCNYFLHVLSSGRYDTVPFQILETQYVGSPHQVVPIRTVLLRTIDWLLATHGQQLESLSRHFTEMNQHASILRLVSSTDSILNTWIDTLLDYIIPVSDLWFMMVDEVENLSNTVGIHYKKSL